MAYTGSMAAPILDFDPAELARFDRPGPRYTSYPTAVDFRADFGPADYAAALARADRDVSAPLGLYVHLPFCPSLCTYCACNVVVRRDPAAAGPYLERLGRELELVAAHLPRRRTVNQLHLGGGTPNHVGLDALAALVARLEDRFDFTPGAERSLEVDPRLATPDQLHALAGLGFNRVSLGVQDADDGVQAMIGRHQSWDQTAAAFHACREAGFEQINIDLVYGLPGQTATTFQATLDRIVELGPERVAVFSFAYVPWLKPMQKRLDADSMPSREGKFGLYLQALRTLTAGGYRGIGMDHFARPGDELCRALDEGRLTRNFQGYAVAKSDDLVGLGMTAIGNVGDAYVQNHRQLRDYRRALDAGRLPVTRGVALSADDRLRRQVIMELMCRFELDPEKTEKDFSVNDLWEIMPEERVAVEALADEGLVAFAGRRLEVTPLGRLFVRLVAMAFDRYRRQPRPASAGPVFSRTV